MEILYFDGQVELKPNTTSFNTVIDALARSREKGSEQKAEALLEHMDELSTTVEELRNYCQPDETSFNTVLSWARSPVKGSSMSTEEILKHMEQRYKTETPISNPMLPRTTQFSPPGRDQGSRCCRQSGKVLRRMEAAAEDGNLSETKRNQLTFTSMFWPSRMIH
jgi:hypothetical protein